MSSVGLKTRPNATHVRTAHDAVRYSAAESVSRLALPERQSASPISRRRPHHPAWYRSHADELVHALTHGAGLVLASSARS